ncbi:MAG: hypothetical protein ACRDFX_05080 [Chloroflexota bacterium]
MTKTFQRLLFASAMLALATVAWIARPRLATPTPAARAAPLGKVTGGSEGPISTVPPLFMAIRQFPFLVGNTGLTGTPPRYPFARLDPVPASLSNAASLTFADPGSDWLSPPAGLASGFRLNSAAKYEGAGVVVLVDVVQPSSSVKTQGVTLPGDTFALPNGSTAHSLTAIGRDGTAYIVQWQRGGYVLQLKLEGSGSVAAARNLAGMVSLTG